jgi:Phosphoribosyl-ATP pyrophosphohydrolase
MGPSSPYKRDSTTYDTPTSSENRNQRPTKRPEAKKPDTFKKGRFGEASKIEEEFKEWKEANSEGYKVLEQLELVDLLGAIIGYAAKKFNIDSDSLLREAKAKNRTMSKRGK